MERVLVHVEQGNGNGRAIDINSEEVLITTDLVGCIAVLIHGKDKCYMIHSDSNDNSGIGKISLVNGIKAAGLNLEEHYEVGLIGGISQESLQVKYTEIKKVLSNSNLKMFRLGVDSAYLESTGFMAYTKSSLAKQLGIESEELKLISSCRYLPQCMPH